MESKATYCVKYEHMKLCTASSKIDAEDIAQAMNKKYNSKDYYVVMVLTVTKEREVS